MPPTVRVILDTTTNTGLIYFVSMVSDKLFYSGDLSNQRMLKALTNLYGFCYELYRVESLDGTNMESPPKRWKDLTMKGLNDGPSTKIPYGTRSS